MGGNGLRLDALSGVDEEEGALARGEGTGDFVGEVNMAGGIDKIEEVIQIVFWVPEDHGSSLRLDGNATFAFHLKGVGVLGLGFFLGGSDIAYSTKNEIGGWEQGGD